MKIERTREIGAYKPTCTFRRANHPAIFAETGPRSWEGVKIEWVKLDVAADQPA